jgi:hypothetical protein
MLAFALDHPSYRLDPTRIPRSDLVEERIARLLDVLAIEYYYEAVEFPHGWDAFGNVRESSNPDFYLPPTEDRRAIVIEVTIVGHPDLVEISGGNYTEARGRAAMQRKRRQAGRRLYYHGINTLLIDWPLCAHIWSEPAELLRLIDRTARRPVIMTHRLAA